MLYILVWEEGQATGTPRPPRGFSQARRGPYGGIAGKAQVYIFTQTAGPK
jgi:hypothetical protein